MPARRRSHQLFKHVLRRFFHISRAKNIPEVQHVSTAEDQSIWTEPSQCPAWLQSRLVNGTFTLAELFAELKSCGNSRDLARGKLIHAAVVRNGQDSNNFVVNSLIDMYAKCGSMVDARHLFESMQRHDVVSWTVLMLGYANKGEGQLVLELFSRMGDEASALPNSRTFIAALKGCINLAIREDAMQLDGKSVKKESLERGVAIHCHARNNGCDSHTHVANTLIDMYGKCGSLDRARGVFDNMQQREVASWTTLMLGYVENGEGEKALELFSCMQAEGCEPDNRVFVAALKACSILALKEEPRRVDEKLIKVESLARGMAIHSRAKTSCCDQDFFVASTLVDMYAKCRSMVDARAVFEKMRHRDVVCWTALMFGYVETGEEELALELFSRMRPEGCLPDGGSFVAALKACSSLAAREEGTLINGKLMKPMALGKGMAIHGQAHKAGANTYVLNSLIEMYASCGSTTQARNIFDKMHHRTLVSWNSLMLGYAENGEGEQALELFSRMRPEGFAPASSSFVAALKACSVLAGQEEGKNVSGVLVKMEALEKGVAIHSQAKEEGCEMNVFVANMLVDMYAKCGSLAEAVSVFEKMDYHDVISWNALMFGYLQNGEVS